MAISASLVLALAVAALTLSPDMPGSNSVAGLDKVAHLLGFAAIAVPLAWRFPQHWRMVALAVLAYGGVIEIVQPAFGRGAEWGDLLADGLGAFGGALLAARMRGAAIRRA